MSEIPTIMLPDNCQFIHHEVCSDTMLRVAFCEHGSEMNVMISWDVSYKKLFSSGETISISQRAKIKVILAIFQSFFIVARAQCYSWSVGHRLASKLKDGKVTDLLPIGRSSPSPRAAP